MLTTVVAVHKQTRKVYLVSTTWGFDKEEGWVEANVYSICGTHLKTVRGSKETCYLSIYLDTDEDNKGYEEEYLPQIRLRLDYYCPTTEYRYLRFEPWENSNHGTRIWQKEKSCGIYLKAEDLTTGLDLDQEDDSVTLHERLEVVGNEISIT